MREINEYDICWNTGVYTAQDCEYCPYKDDCSGYEDKDD